MSPVQLEPYYLLLLKSKQSDNARRKEHSHNNALKVLNHDCLETEINETATAKRPLRPT
jgi:hypothetical protein